ncbi:MAG: primosomal protein N' [bacterium]
MSRTRIASIIITTYPRLPNRLFDYLIEAPVLPGSLVIVPFGKSEVIGIIDSIQDCASSTIDLKVELKSVTRILDHPPLPEHYLKLAQWLSTYYAATPRSVWQSLLPSGLKVKTPRLKLSDTQPLPTIDILPLSPDQTAVVQTINTAQVMRPVLIEGVTGSGKTHIYEELIAQTIAAGKSVLMLAPEIVLSTQLESRLVQYFGNQLHVSHSQLTAATRRNLWLQALNSSQPQIYLGPRSVLFLPISNLGLIIIDEEHDSSYKQDQAPRYHSLHVAAKLAQLTNAQLILGSATPSLSTLGLCSSGGITHVKLDNRFGEASLPEISLIKLHKQDGLISDQLKQAMIETLARNEQIIILHNQRGSARRLTCDDCGTSIQCHHCDTPLIFHADTGRLKCHICNRAVFPPSRCPTCQGTNLYYSGTGTKQIEQEIQTSFPQASVHRLDRDSQDLDKLPELLTSMHSGEINILIGTQMIAKGLDFPGVTLVVVIDADTMLHGVDYLASEQAASLMMQVAGRAGRADRVGQVIIQTRQTQHPVLQAVKNHDWGQFSQAELQHRHQFGYPPNRWLARVWIKRSSVQKAESDALQLIQTITQKHPGLIVLGPAAPNLNREGGWHTRQLVLKSTKRQLLVEICSSLPSAWSHDLDPIHIV